MPGFMSDTDLESLLVYLIQYVETQIAVLEIVHVFKWNIGKCAKKCAHIAAVRAYQDAFFMPLTEQNFQSGKLA